MSCVIGLKHNGKVYVGGDGRATSTDGEKRPLICKKVFKNSKYLIGFCGSVRAGQLLYPEQGFEPPKKIIDFPKAMRELYGENGALLRDELTGDIYGSNIVVASDGKLFEILIDFSILEVPTFTSIGSGGPFAFGALDILMPTKLSPKNKILKALETAAKYCSQVGPPYEVQVC